MDEQLAQALDQAVARARQDGHVVLAVLWPDGEALRYSVGSMSTVVLERYNPPQCAAILGAMVGKALTEVASMPGRRAQDAQGENDRG